MYSTELNGIKNTSEANYLRCKHREKTHGFVILLISRRDPPPWITAPKRSQRMTRRPRPHFGIHESCCIWFAAADSLTLGTFILVAGWLGDSYGHRLLFVLTFGRFSLWSLLAGHSLREISLGYLDASLPAGPALKSSSTNSINSWRSSKATRRCRVWRMDALITAFLLSLLPPSVVVFFAMVLFMAGYQYLPSCQSTNPTGLKLPSSA